MKKSFAMVAIVTFVLSGCASTRGVKVGSDANAAYRVDVHNTHSSSVTVSYADSRGSHQLGTVAAGRTEQFVIASPSATTVTVMGITAAGGHYETTVSLAAGITTKANL